MDPMIFASACVVVIGAVAAAAVAIIKQLQAIHHLVDGTASKLATETTAAADKLKAETLTAVNEFKETARELRATISTLQSQRVTDAQTQAAQAQAIERQPQAAPVPPIVAKQVVEHQVVDKQSVKKGSE